MVGFFLLLLFGRQSPIGHALEQTGLRIAFSWPATVITASVVAFPLMYRAALGAFEQVNPNLLGAARTLGAGEWRTSFASAAAFAARRAGRRGARISPGRSANLARP